MGLQKVGPNRRKSIKGQMFKPGSLGKNGHYVYVKTFNLLNILLLQHDKKVSYKNGDFYEIHNNLFSAVYRIYKKQQVERSTG